MIASGSIPERTQRPHPLQISPGELADLKRRGGALHILDVREAWEIELCAFEGSRHIPIEELPHRLGELEGEGLLIVVCHHGIRSLRATLWLRDRGFERAVNLDGGIDGWAREIDPIMQTY